MLNVDPGTAVAANLNLDVNAGAAKLNTNTHLASLNIANGADGMMPANGNRTLYTRSLNLIPRAPST